MSKLYIVLPVHNRREITRRFVECLAHQTLRDFQLILVDDGSTDGTAEMVCERILNTVVLRGTGNWWWGGSLHQGYLWLKSGRCEPDDGVLLINDDTEFDCDYLANGLSVLSRERSTIVTSQVFSRKTRQFVEAGIEVIWSQLKFIPASGPEKINCASTRGLFLRADDFLKLGGFHPRLLPHYGSDYEFTIRAHRNGLRLVTDPSVKLFADEDATGYHKLGREGLIKAMRQLFSKKSPLNPVMWTAFILLSCPARHVPWSLARVWKRTVGRVLRAAFV